MNEICCDSDIFTIYQSETGFVKRSKVSVKANGSAGLLSVLLVLVHKIDELGTRRQSLTKEIAMLSVCRSHW